MLAYVSVCDKNISEAASTDMVDIRKSARTIAIPRSLWFFIQFTHYGNGANSVALILSNRRAQTAPPFIPSQIGTGLQDWTVIAAGTVLFLLPVAIFTFLLRNHLLRGMSFGAIRK